MLKTRIGSDPPVDEQMCRTAVDALLARHQWQLLEHDDFVRRTLEHVRSGIATDSQRAATYTYSLALHAACSGAMGADRQNLAYTELFRYLYDNALRRYPDVRDDATQRALEHTFETFDRCREPGAFLAFALQHLMDAARKLRRQEEQCPWSLSTIVDANHNVDEVLPGQQQADPSSEVIAGELRSRFDRLAAEFLRKHPRASQQFAALRLKYIDGLDEAAIGWRLGKPVQSVYVLRARAIKKLRAEPEWRALAVELGVLSEERS